MHESRQRDGSHTRDRDSRSVGVSRRQALSTVAASTSGIVAGCLSTYIETDPGDTTDGWVTSFPGLLDDFDPLDPNMTLKRFASDVGFVPNLRTGDPTYVLATDVEETASSISITLKPDLKWSNGDPLIAADIGRWVYMYRMGSGNLIPVSDIRNGNSHPRTAWEAITDVDWTDQTLTVEGNFDEAPSPLFDLNTALGSYPRAYYDSLWDSFQDVFTDSESDSEPREAVTTLVDDNIWYLSEEYRPESGIHLEDDYDGTGQEAAFSGLWYPTRIQNGRLHFSMNDAHPFADRVSFDSVYWDFAGERASPVPALRSGSVDGMRLNDVTEAILESVPPHFDSFDGAPRRIISMTVNHRAPYLNHRDVRAALMHVIDRDALVESVGLVNHRPVSIPGADLQSAEWLPDDLRDDMRSYDHDLDRARTLLERAGFQRAGEWKTPSGDTFEIEILSDDRDPTLQHSIEDQLSSFGIDATSTVLESTSYQTHVEDGTFIATDNSLSSPNAAGRRRTRAGDYVRAITSGNGFQDSLYLEREIDAAVTKHAELAWTEESAGFNARSLEFDSIDALRSITVEAPPLGAPNDPVREWPYLYHAVRAECAHGIDETIEHAQICTWIYNYAVPELELMIEVPQIFHDTDHWTVPPSDDPVWDSVGVGHHPGDLWAALGWGHIEKS